MPVTIEFFTVITDQDMADLVKVYQDNPQIMPNKAILEIHIQKQMQQYQLVGARFNGRLQGCAFLEKNAKQWKLHSICIRKINHNRGIEQRLIDVVQARANDANQSLHIIDYHPQ